VRNQLIHGTSDTSSSELVRTIDLGIGILRALYAIPHEIHTVLYAELAIYEDNACTIMRLEVRGVMLESASSGGLIKNVRVFPTRQTGYRPGVQVSWEWNETAKWGESWYIDPETGESKYAWTVSIELRAVF
jgi:hypothetical protein